MICFAKSGFIDWFKVGKALDCFVTQELVSLQNMVRPEGFEPSTTGFEVSDKVSIYIYQS
jgi:hypothetical protein